MNDLARLATMNRLWDEAHSALSRRDLPAFDKAMNQFREHQREAGSAQEAPARNS